MRNDAAYANSAHIPGGAGYPRRWAGAARRFRDQATAQGLARPDLPYGPNPRHRFDLFLPAGRPRGLVVLIHGGYWLEFGREDFSHLARGPVAAGWACALPSYTHAPEARIGDITREVAQAVTAAAALVQGPVALTGHSAGGHLAARLLCPDIALPVRGRLAACVPVSPLGDLRPLLETSMNASLRLDAAEALAESPALSQPVAGVPVTVFAGAIERPAFLAQARQLAAAWGGALRLEAGRHHFDVIEGFDDPQGAMVQALTRPPPGAG